VVLRPLHGWQVAEGIKHGISPAPCRPHALILCQLYPKSNIRLISLLDGRADPRAFLESLAIMMSKSAHTKLLREGNSSSNTPKLAALEGLGYRPHEILFEDDSLAMTAKSMLEAISVCCGVAGANADVDRYVNVLSARMVRSGALRIG